MPQLEARIDDLEKLLPSERSVYNHNAVWKFYHNFDDARSGIPVRSINIFVIRYSNISVFRYSPILTNRDNTDARSGKISWAPESLLDDSFMVYTSSEECEEVASAQAQLPPRPPSSR